MAQPRLKSWVPNEVLTASDLNAEFNNILNNGEDVPFPATKSKDFNGFELILDADADTSITADTDDRVDFKVQGQDLFRMDGTTASSVNGMDFVGSATGNAVQIAATGSDTNVDLQIRSKGSGNVILADSGGEEILICDDVASAVNEVTITNAATSNDPSIAATGGDTNIDLNLVSKGSGVVQANGVAVDAFASGTEMAFFQAAAPTAWTQNVTNTDAMLRVVSGAGGGTGGTASPTTGLTITDSHVLTIAQMPSHLHGQSIVSGVNVDGPNGTQGDNSVDNASAGNTAASGGGLGHTHNITWAPKFIDMIICSKD